MNIKNHQTFLVAALLVGLWAAQSAYAFYDPGLQRWINRDPIGERGGINLYRSVGNNPINKKDPKGLSFGNPVSGPSGVVGPSSPYAPGGAYYVPNPSLPPAFAGGEAHFIIGSGITRVACCDENNTKRIFWYRKVCIGGAIGFGGGGGVVFSGLSGTNCRGQNYEGWFYELGGSLGPAGLGLDLGYTDRGDLSGVNEAGGGLSLSPPGIQFKSTWCYYTLFYEQHIPCGCSR